MQERVKLTDAQINKDLLRSMEENPLWYWLLVGALGLAVLVAFAAVAYMFNRGLGVTGLNRPVMWGFFITNFVFWIGISHAGVMLSAILRLVQAEWRRPATRAAEVLTVFSLMTAMTMPLIHAGRPWRVMYWVFPFDWARGVYPNVRSALVWDPSAVFTYLTSSILFVFIALIPDIAVARDRTTGWEARALLGAGARLEGERASVEAAADSGHSAIGGHPPHFRLGAQHSLLGLRCGRVGRRLAQHCVRAVLRHRRGPLRRVRRCHRDDHPALDVQVAGLHPAGAPGRAGEAPDRRLRRRGSSSSCSSSCSGCTAWRGRRSG